MKKKKNVQGQGELVGDAKLASDVPATSSVVPGVALPAPGVVPDQVLSAKEVMQAEKLQLLGADIIKSTIEVGKKYLKMVQYIRENQVSQKLVTFELRQLGFAKSRVSEINRIAHCDNKTFSLFEAGTIGIRKVLALSRESAGKVAGLLGEGVTEVEVDDLTALAGEMEETAKDKAAKAAAPDKVESKQVKINKSALALLRLCKEAKKRKHEWFWDGLKLTLAVNKEGAKGSAAAQ